MLQKPNRSDRAFALADFNASAVDAICRELSQTHRPGMGVGIATHGTPIYRKGFGLASMELPLELSPNVRMRIGSMSKHFTSLAVMLLCEDGLARLDDPLGKFIPEATACCREVTLHQLMHHTSGLRDSSDFCYQLNGPGHPISTDQLSANYEHFDDVNFPPGTSWTYNNGGYVLLATVVERISGSSFEHFLTERICRPAGLHDTILRRWDTDFVPNSATLHMTRSDGTYHRSYLGISGAGQGGMVSTVDDMLRWLRQMSDPLVGTAETWAAMVTPAVLPNGMSTGYGLGLMHGRYREVEILHHGGSVMGGSSEMIKVPSLGLDIIVMVNRHDLSATLIAQRIMDLCIAGMEEPVSKPPADQVTGIFKSAATGRVVELVATPAGQVASIDGWDLPVVRDPEGVFNPRADLAFFKQWIRLIGDDDDLQGIEFSHFGDVDRLRALDAANPTSAADAVGIYLSPTGLGELDFEVDHEGARLTARGLFGTVRYALRSLGDGNWRAEAEPRIWGGVLSIEGDSLFFSSARNRRLRFDRAS